MIHDLPMEEKRSLLRRFTAPICALLLLAFVAVMPRADVKPRMKVALSVWPGTEALVLARDEKLLPVDRIRVVELPWASAVSRTFDDDMVDAAVMTLDAVMQLRETGEKMRVVMVLDQSTGGDAVLARPEITTVANLKGKRVGVDVFGVGMHVLVNALEQEGMSLKDIEIVPLIQPEIDGMLHDNHIDAAVASEPWLTQINRHNLHRIYDSSALKTPALRVLVASEIAVTQFKEELAAVMRAMNSVTGQVRSGKKFPGMTSILRREKVTFEQFVENLARWQPKSRQENQDLLAGKTPKLEVLAKQMEEQMLRHGLLNSAPDNAPWIDPQFLEHAWD